MNTMILYYSRSGNTEKLAKRIQADLDCQMIKIMPDEEYGNYIASCLRVSKEKRQVTPPRFITPIPDLTDYKVVLLGFPIWAQDLPQFVSEFISQCNLVGKTVIPFATFGMSGLSWTKKTINRVCSDAMVMLPYDQGLIKKDDYSKWISNVRSEVAKRDIQNN